MFRRVNPPGHEGSYIDRDILVTERIPKRISDAIAWKPARARRTSASDHHRSAMVISLKASLDVHGDYYAL